MDLDTGTILFTSKSRHPLGGYCLLALSGNGKRVVLNDREIERAFIYVLP